MAGLIKINAVQLGDSATATQNFVWQTNVDGTAKLSRGNVGATTQDILKVDAAGILTALGDKLIYNRGNVLGTVSQAGGVPTGAVIERGSNANGEYVRYADGTQICQKTGVPTLLNSSNIGFQWTFPAVFAGANPSASFSLSNPDVMTSKIAQPIGYGVATTGATLSLLNNASAFVSGDIPSAIYCFAIGRWF